MLGHMMRAALPLMLAALVTPGHSVLCVPSRPYDPIWVSNLSLWLEAAYSESGDRAGFGDIGPDRVWTPNLYSTYGSILSLRSLGIIADASESVGNWINSLLNEQGAYDDPLNDAPPTLETYWALATLQALGVEPIDPIRIAGYILSLQRSSGLFQSDSGPADSLYEDIASTSLCLEILRIAGRGTEQLALEAAQAAARGAAQIMETLLADCEGDWRRLGGIEAEEFRALVGLLAAASPAMLHDQEKAALLYYLDQIAGTETGFLGPVLINSVLDAAEEAGIITEDSIPGLPGLRDYLLTRIRPEIEALGGYGWDQGVAAKLDPVMTEPTVLLFSRAGLEYPGRDQLVETLAKYRRSEGWSTFAIVVPTLDFTLFGAGIAQEVCWPGFSPAKILTYAMDVLESLDADPYNLYFALRVATTVGASGTGDALAVREAAERLYRIGIDERDVLLVSLLAELGIPPPLDITDVLREMAGQMAAFLSSSLRMETVRDLVLIQRILGEVWLTAEDLEKLIDSLEADGGYRVIPESPAPDLKSTALAIESLCLLGRQTGIDIPAVSLFVVSCQREYGFAWTPAGSILDSDPDFYSTYVALDTLHLLQSLQETGQ